MTRVVQFGSEPLFDDVLPHAQLAQQVTLAKQNLSSLHIPVTVSELAYGYQERGGAQDVLNAIALDIRTKSRRRIQRQRELEGVRLTLGNLHEKAQYLEQQRKSYDDYIEQAMLTLQKNKGYVATFCHMINFSYICPPSSYLIVPFWIMLT